MVSYLISLAVSFVFLISLSSSAQFLSVEPHSVAGGWTGSSANSWSSSAKGAFGGSSASVFGSHIRPYSTFKNEPNWQTENEEKFDKVENKPATLKLTGWIEPNAQ
uniref:Secreted protein n=1 Tax=Ascaris lumbricoides TaxID=6252 RepID=A0A0M3I583_ASCLU